MAILSRVIYIYNVYEKLILLRRYGALDVPIIVSLFLQQETFVILACHHFEIHVTI